jgi:CubicO group peptidase (beta-lactamase class C family)
VAAVWPGFARAGKEAITVRQLLNHRSGLVAIEQPLTLADFADPARVSAALEAQEPLWTPGSRQGYGAIAWGPYAGELFRHAAGERLGGFLRREVARPLEADVHLGLPRELDERVATLYPVRKRDALVHIVPRLVASRGVDGRVFRRVLVAPKSISGRAFHSRPSFGRKLLGAMNEPRWRRLELPWANLHASARGLARADAPLALDGSWRGTRLVRPEAIEQVTPRQTWSERDTVLQKPLGFSQGYCKDELHLISPNPRAFGHSGMGGSVGFADPDAQLAFGYVMNRMDFRVRSPRCVALCNAIYRCLSERVPASAVA